MTPVCPYCRTPVDDAANRHDCTGCGTPHHEDCYAENGGCTVFGCSKAPADEPKVSITGTETMQQPIPAPTVTTAPATRAEPESEVWRPPSVLGLSAPAPALSVTDANQTQAAPPPQLPSIDTTSVPPPPLPAGAVGMPMPGVYAPAGPASLAEVYSGFHPAKNRVTFVLLGVFLGALGVHNFYAGYFRKAAAQLCLSIFTCFYGSVVSWIWAIVEVCTITEDSDGVQFS